MVWRGRRGRSREVLILSKLEGQSVSAERTTQLKEANV